MQIKSQAFSSICQLSLVLKHTMFSEELASNFCWNKNSKSWGTLDEKESWDTVFYVTHLKKCEMWLYFKCSAIVKEVLCKQGDQSGYAEGQVLEEWIFHWRCSHRSFCSRSVLCLALRECYCRCCSFRKVIWLVGKHTGHKSPLSSVFLPLCADGTEHG